MDQHLTQVAIAALADAQQPGLPACAGLPWYEPEPSGKATAPRERFAGSDRRDQGRRVQHTDARDGRQTTGGRVGPGLCGKLILESPDPPIEFAPLGLHVLNQRPHPRAERDVATLAQHRRKMLLQLAAPL